MWRRRLRSRWVLGMDGIEDHIRKIFINYGFQAQAHPKLNELNLGGFSLPFFGTQGNISVAAGFKTGKGTKEDISGFAEVIKILGADQGVFISVSGFDENAKYVGKNERIFLWDRSTLCAEIGKMVLSEIEQKKPKAGIVQEGRELYARIRIGDQVAAIIGKRRLVDIKSVNLKLVPHYVFNHSMELLEEGSLDIKHFSGRFMVNSITKEVLEVPEGLELIESLTEPHIKLSTAYSKYDAFSSVHDLLKKLGTRTIEVQEVRGSTVLSVKRPIYPKEDSIRIEDKGIVYMPLWHLEGSDGIVEIDGITGRIVSERKRS